ncbi:MAG: hypothetical protein NC211_02430 [Alistipes senegalensis]|nr:hypothetical protein [Oxalobacter formigenes]MCM1280681.1 hypothetical protein [Alistipes senegalensis]
MIVPDIDSGIPLPRRFIYFVTGSLLPGFPEKILANGIQIRKPDILWRIFHCLYHFFGIHEASFETFYIGINIDIIIKKSSLFDDVLKKTFRSFSGRHCDLNPKRAARQGGQRGL